MKIGSLLYCPVVFALLLVGILAACTSPSQPPGPPSSGPQCTNMRAPVCGQRGLTLRTFTNACHARRDGFAIIASGECGRMTHSQVCTRESIPVCGDRNGRRQTFGNACLATVEGYRVVGAGRCR